jgi:hypothetical protein
MGKIDQLKKSTQDIKSKLGSISMGKENLNLIDSVQRLIQRVREPGAKPRSDASDPALDVYICDLCLKKITKGEMTQCSLCGRWICVDSCLDGGEGTCGSCASIIRLNRESILHIKDIAVSLKDHQDKMDGKEGDAVENNSGKRKQRKTA